MGDFMVAHGYLWVSMGAWVSLGAYERLCV